MQNEIVNKVAASGLVTIDLEELRPSGERAVLDIKDVLYEGLVLREKDFREYIKVTDWSKYTGKHVAVGCSADAVVPTWAFMLLAVALRPYAATVVFGTLAQLEERLYVDTLRQLDWSKYQNARVVVKGCSDRAVPPAAYVELATRLHPIVQSLMFGEPCSTVPLFKRRT